MGRDVAGLRIDKKPNVKSNGMVLERVHVAPRISKEKVDTKEQEFEDHNPKGAADEESQEKQDVLGVKSTNTEAGVPDGKTKGETLKPSEKKSNSPIKPAPMTFAAESLHSSSPTFQSPEPSSEKHASHSSNVSGFEKIDAGICPSSGTNDLRSPVTAKKPQPHSPLTSRKLLQSYSSQKHHDEEDNFSLASSTATSVRSSRSKITVPVAPTFRSADRATIRKEFYVKLEEKHKALEAEKLEYAARTKEEEEAAIKQLRKAMVYKANPVPNFYREGPPPKMELKKLPVTRAKSPNFTRRKSCSDTVKSSPDDKKVCGRVTRHSIGSYKNESASPSAPKKKDLSGTRNVFKDSNGASKVKARPKLVKETVKTQNTQSEQMSTDIRIVAETKSSDTTIKHNSENAVEEEEMKSTNISCY